MVKKRGLTEVLFLEWDFGNRDFGPIANRIKDAKPDFVWVGAIGLDGNLLLDAMKKIDYVPPQHFYLYPAPGPLVSLPEAKNALSVTIFEEQPPFTNAPGAAEFVKLYRERATAAKLPDPSVEVQAGASYTAWQILEAGVMATKSLDDKAIAHLAQGQPRRHHPGQAALRRRRQLRRRPDAHQAGAGRPLDRGLAEVAHRGRRHAASQLMPRMSGFTLPSATLLAQSILSGIFVGALYGLLGLGLSLSWGLLRLINLAHFAFAFLAAYLCYQMATMGHGPAADAGGHRAAVLRASAPRCTGRWRASRSRRSTRCS